MNKQISSKIEIDIAKLRSLYGSNVSTKAIFDYFANRERDAKETKVDRLVKVLENLGHSISRSDVIKFFKQLEEIGCGKFIAGRKGHPSRFEWVTNLTDVGRVASGQWGEIHPVSGEVTELPEEETIKEEFLEHEFILRRDFKVKVVLPGDLTNNEARRLAEYIKTLPLEQE